MGLSQRLDLRQGQSLTMTPQLQQAIKLLQMSHFELLAFVETELERNPLLERVEGLDTIAAPAPEAAGPDDVSARLEQSASPEDKIESLGVGAENVFADEARADAANRMAASGVKNDGVWSGPAKSGRESFDADTDAFDTLAARDVTLYDHLASQLMLATTDPVLRLIGHTLIGMVDEAGYLVGELEGVAQQLGTSPVQVEDALALLQGFDPAGVGARSLKECLCVQLRERNRLDPAMQRLLDRLDLLAARDYRALVAWCGVDLDDIRQMVTEIRALDPKPGLKFGSELLQSVVPDILVREAPDGSWLVELNTDTLPRVLVNQHYAALVGRTRDADTVYVAECQTQAQWLVRSLDQRARTILKVAREIVRQQDLFLAHGVHHLRPLTLKTVAEAISMHESTVSRVTSNKFMTTPRGTFDLKYFFSAALMDADGDASHSAEAVRQRIRSLIAGETAEAVLSDDQIMDALGQAGIAVARRTVAKYREALGLASSVQRRRELRMAAAKPGS